MIKTIPLHFDEDDYSALRKRKGDKTWEDFFLGIDTLDLIHTKIHALRMIPNYKASPFEADLNKIIAEEFQKNCKECKERLDKLKSQPAQSKSFWEVFKQ